MKALLARLDTSAEQLLEELKIEAIMVMSSVFCLEMNIQILVDVLMSKDGKLGGHHRDPRDP